MWSGRGVPGSRTTSSGNNGSSELKNLLRIPLPSEFLGLYATDRLARLDFESVESIEAPNGIERVGPIGEGGGYYRCVHGDRRSNCQDFRGCRRERGAAFTRCRARGSCARANRPG